MVLPAISNNKGATLIELVIAIVVAGIVFSALMSSFANTFSRSVDPMIMQQSLLSAKALMEEILAKPFLDPADKSLCPAKPANRTAYDNICDYNGYSTTGIKDNAGSSIDSLAQYSMSVSITRQLWGGISANQNMRIQVTVNNPLNRPVVLTAYRTCYEYQECFSL